MGEPDVEMKAGLLLDGLSDVEAPPQKPRVPDLEGRGCSSVCAPPLPN